MEKQKKQKYIKDNYYNNTMVIINKGKTTYIQISKEVADKLNKIKLVPRESYEDVLRRLLKMDKRIVAQKWKHIN